MKSKFNVWAGPDGKLMNTVGVKAVPTGFTAPEIELTSFVPSDPANDPVPPLSVNSLTRTATPMMKMKRKCQ